MTAFSKMEKIVSDQIEWYFRWSECDCGVSSSWSSMVNNCIYGQAAPFQDPNWEDIFKNVRKFRQIQKKLTQLSDKQHSILYYSYADPPQQHHFNKYFGDCAAAALHTSLLPLPRLMVLSDKIAVAKVKEDERALLEAIRAQAEADLKDAVETFYKIRE